MCARHKLFDFDLLKDAEYLNIQNLCGVLMPVEYPKKHGKTSVQFEHNLNTSNERGMHRVVYYIVGAKVFGHLCLYVLKSFSFGQS